MKWVIYKMSKTVNPSVEKIYIFFGHFTPETPYLVTVAPHVAYWSPVSVPRDELDCLYCDMAL